ncbi:hypothetical protein BO94DRAFT_41609 [Aspergillus sclerotioniger CBS 115572]|uniref:Uncharacterized protein n=1 Tax=Aspergillus sclerotioniger CBS 115572 TaxID=1450535 RepID=A0A317WU18_9EURO|nr:hypothetical protein BO94DRAFT_41609 [Aspergillus sclerotioniger CBS 115572]PWY89585.1 hypothetical protein BO94DRAFT_41609 [Aspergillus sclerotioniger CBS 115572]
MAPRKKVIEIQRAGTNLSRKELGVMCQHGKRRVSCFLGSIQTILVVWWTPVSAMTYFSKDAVEVRTCQIGKSPEDPGASTAFGLQSFPVD